MCTFYGNAYFLAAVTEENDQATASIGGLVTSWATPAGKRVSEFTQGANR